MRKIVVPAPHTMLIASKTNRSFAPQDIQSLGNGTSGPENEGYWLLCPGGLLSNEDVDAVGGDRLSTIIRTIG
jgi:hypothetical protein